MIYKTLVPSSTHLFTKYHMFKRYAMQMTGYILIRRTLSMTLHFLILSSFLFTRNLRIDKNYMLSIFMLSGSIQFYSNFQFNLTCIYLKIMPFISNYTHVYSFHMLSLYKSLIIFKYAFSHVTNHSTIQFMRFKRTLLKMCLVYKSHLHSSKLVI